MTTESTKKKWLQTLQFLAAYLVAAWTFLQFVDWILNRYNISPYWVDLLLWVFVGIIPSLAIYFFNKERINKRILNRREKVLFPLNVLLIMAATYFGFGNSDLGATTKEIKYTDEAGVPQSKTITKEEFRIGIPIYGFENTKNNDSISWWRYGIGDLLVHDLEQNKSLSPYSFFYTETSTKITEASTFEDFYVDGNYEKNGDDIIINVFIRKSNNAKVLSQQSFTGTNFLDLLDEISFFITEEAGFVETNTIRYLDYPISEFMSASEKAMKEFVNGNYDEAVAIDSTFAMAYLEDAKRSQRFNSGALEVQDIIDKAYKYRNELPLQKQLEVNIQRSLAYGNLSEAEELVDLQLQVDPTNEFYNQVLFSIYGQEKELDKYYERSEYLFYQDPKPANGINMANAALVTGQDKLLLQEIKAFELVNPDLKYFRIQPYLFQEKFDEAEDLLNELDLVKSGYQFRAQVYDTAVAYLQNNGLNKNYYQPFEGRFRYSATERVMTFWIEYDRLLCYTKNGRTIPFVLSGKYKVANGLVNDLTREMELVLDSSKRVIGMLERVFDYRTMGTYWHWKEDESITKAHKAFEAGDLEKAKSLYEIALENNPKHSYLKNILDHITYKLTTDPEVIKAQNERYVGTYGPRQFYIIDDKLYYKRKSDETNLPRVQLLPMDETRYMDLTRFNTIMEFGIDSTGVMSSSGYNFSVADNKFVWEELNRERNYFLKDD